MWFKEKSYDIKTGQEWVTREQLGFFLFTRVNLLDYNYKKKILDMLQEFLELIHPEQLDLLRYGPNARSYKNKTQVNFSNFEKHFKNFKYRYDSDNRIFDLGYEIDLKKDCGKKNTIGDIRFYINMMSFVNDNKSNLRNLSCHQIAIFVPKDFDKINELIKFTKKYYALLKCCYGYINPVIAYNKVEFGKISDILERYANGNDIFDIPDNVGNNTYLETKVKGVHWGQVLSETHIKQLGGREEIKQELGDFIVEEISPNILFIRMPFDIPLKKTDDVIRHYKKLAQFLEPIFIPQWNGSDVGLRIGIHRTGDKFLRRFL